MKTSTRSVTTARADRLLATAQEPNLWNLGWPVVEERSRIGQWLRTLARAAWPRKCDASVSDS